MERKLATIRKIDKLEPIEGADKILKATIGGWQLVTAKDNGFNEGDLVVYLEVDSWVPHDLAPFLSKGKEPREFNGVKGERLRTIRLRGQLSQGLLLPVDECFGDTVSIGGKLDCVEGEDVTELLGIQKWEKPIPAQLAGVCRSTFPSDIRKTDQERVQNLQKELDQWVNKEIVYWEITEKLEGSSMTVYSKPVFDYEYNQWIIDLGVCSRNMDLKLDQQGNAFVDTARKSGLLDALVRLGKNIAVQGELVGPGIQGNIYGLKELEFYVYDIWDIEKQEYLTPETRYNIINNLQKLGAKIKHVPILGEEDVLMEANIQKILDAAEGTSELADTEREGIVFKSLDGKYSFKAISNKYLLGEKE